MRVPYSAVYDLQGEKIGALRIYLSMDLLMQQLGGTPSSEERVEPSV